MILINACMYIASNNLLQCKVVSKPLSTVHCSISTKHVHNMLEINVHLKDTA